MIADSTWETAGQWHVAGPIPTKNSRYRIVRLGRRSGLRNSERFQDFVHRLREEVVRTKHKRVDRGAYGLMVDAYWPKVRHLEGTDVPHGDFDAALSAVSDALELAGVIDNDARIVWGYARKFFDRIPWVNIRLVHVQGGRSL